MFPSLTSLRNAAQRSARSKLSTVDKKMLKAKRIY
jgi:hypothetical protein